jgi:type II secretory ATPase GspE/PulE/Tfp pilus assembly ATPase PilB-like protein
VTLGATPFPFPEPWASTSEVPGSLAPILALLEPAPGELDALIHEAARRLVLVHLAGRRTGSFVWRFLKSGVGPPRLASVLTLLLEHRAVRRRCAQCQTPPSPSPGARAPAGPAASGETECAACAFSPGYRGRESLIAALPGRGPLASQIQSLAPRAVWEPAGLRATLHTAGLDLVRRGLTSMEELRRLRLTPGR